MKDLIAKINAGRYTISTKEPLSIECALFLSQCLQANESNRIDYAQLQNHPFVQIANDYTNAGEIDGDLKLTILDQDAFMEDNFNASNVYNTSVVISEIKETVTKQSFLKRTVTEKAEIVLSTQE